MVYKFVLVWTITIQQDHQVFSWRIGLGTCWYMLESTWIDVEQLLQACSTVDGSLFQHIPPPPVEGLPHVNPTLLNPTWKLRFGTS